MQKETLSLQDFKKLENKTELSFPITIGVLRSKNRLNFWQSKAFDCSIFYHQNIIFIVQFLIFYFAINNSIVGLFFLVLTILSFFVRKSELLKSNAIFEPSRFFKKDIDYRYDDILIIHSDRIEFLGYFKKFQGVVYFKDIECVGYEHGKIMYKYTKSKYKDLKFSNKKMGWFRSKYLEVINEKLIINDKYLTNLSEVGNLIIHSYLQKPPIYLTYHKGFPQEGFKINSNQ